MNQGKFDGLTPEQQEIVVQTAKDAVAMQRELSTSQEEERIAELESHGMEVNRDVDAAAFQDATKGVWDNFIAENGDALIVAIQETSK